MDPRVDQMTIRDVLLKHAEEDRMTRSDLVWLAYHMGFIHHIAQQAARNKGKKVSAFFAGYDKTDIENIVELAGVVAIEEGVTMTYIPDEKKFVFQWKEKWRE